MVLRIRLIILASVGVGSPRPRPYNYRQQILFHACDLALQQTHPIGHFGNVLVFQTKIHGQFYRWAIIQPFHSQSFPKNIYGLMCKLSQNTHLPWNNHIPPIGSIVGDVYLDRISHFS